MLTPALPNLISDFCGAGLKPGATTPRATRRRSGDECPAAAGLATGKVQERKGGWDTIPKAGRMPALRPARDTLPHIVIGEFDQEDAMSLHSPR
jgi:hypothetical protein